MNGSVLRANRRGRFGGANSAQWPQRRLALAVLRLCRMPPAARRLHLLLLDAKRVCLLRQTLRRDRQTKMRLVRWGKTYILYAPWLVDPNGGNGEGMGHGKVVSPPPSPASWLVLWYGVVAVSPVNWGTSPSQPHVMLKLSRLVQ